MQVKHVNRSLLLIFVFFGQMWFGGDSGQVFGQQRMVFNPFFSHFLWNIGVHNTAGYELKNIQASFNYQSRLGSFSGIRELYSEILIKKNQSTAGLRYYSEQESTLFVKNKIQGVYARSLRINTRTNLTLGTQLGLANIRFDGSRASAGGSAWGFDMAVSALLQIQHLKIGAVVHQIPQSSIRPIGFVFLLKRYQELSASYLFEVSRALTLESGLMVAFNDSYFHWSSDHRLTFHKKYGVLMNLQRNKTYSLGVFGLLPLLEHSVAVAINYQTDFAPITTGNETLGVSLIYTK